MLLRSNSGILRSKSSLRPINRAYELRLPAVSYDVHMPIGSVSMLLSETIQRFPFLWFYFRHVLFLMYVTSVPFTWHARLMPKPIKCVSKYELVLSSFAFFCPQEYSIALTEIFVMIYFAFRQDDSLKRGFPIRLTSFMYIS